MQSLRDKLLKAGLVTEEQSKKAEAEKAAKRERPARPPPPRAENRAMGTRPSGGGRSEPPAAKHVPKLPPLALPGSKAYQRLESLRQLELDKKLREIAVTAEVPLEPGEHRFYFMTRKKKLRRLELSEAQAKLLEEGKLAVVERPDPAQIEHCLVPPEAAERLLQLSERAVRFFNKDGAPVGFLSDEEKSSTPEMSDGETVAADAPPPHEESAEGGTPESGA
jgi:hypothetical protein